MNRRNFLKGFIAAATAMAVAPPGFTPVVASLESMPAYAPGVVVTKFSGTGTNASRQTPKFYKIFYGDSKRSFEGEIPWNAPDFGIRPENLKGDDVIHNYNNNHKERVAAAVAMWDRLEAEGKV